MKTFFDKKQAVTVLIQIEKKQEINLFAEVDLKHKYFSLSCEELEKRLLNYLEEDGFAGVIEQP